jgi:hypothetical protein
MIQASLAFNTANSILQKKPVYLIVIEGYSKIFAKVFDDSRLPVYGDVPVVPWIVSIEDQAITINDLDGGADLADLQFTVQDRGAAITVDFASFTFEGKKVSLLCGFDGMSGADFVTLFTGRVDSIESTNGNTEYFFTCPDIRQELTKVIYGTADDGSATDSNHPRTLNGNPLDILLAALQVEVGLDASAIDIAKITKYRDTIYAGAQFEFSITSPPAAKDFIENELLKPLGAYLWSNSLGQISVNFYYPLSIVPVMDFNPDNMTDIPEAGVADLINEVSTRFDYDDSDKPQAELVRQDAQSIAKYGLFGQLVIEARGLRSGLQGNLLAGFTAFLIFARYGFKQLTFGSSSGNSSPISAFWSACLVEPGDIVSMTHPQVPDRLNGVMGISGQTFVVMDRTFHFFECLVEFKRLYIDLKPFQQFLIAANAEGNYTAVSSDDRSRYMFQANDSDQYSNGAPGNTVA